MARTTWTPQQGRHNAFIQSWLHPETLLLGSPIVQALPIWQTGDCLTPDIRTQGIESTRFLPVVKMTTLRFMLGIEAADNLELIQLYVKTAFPHSDLQEEIYREQPRGTSGQEHLVCRLRKSLYGLK